METLQEIETKQLGILSVAKCKRKLNKKEDILFDFLTKKYRDKKGKLLSGSYFINSKSLWEEVN